MQARRAFREFEANGRGVEVGDRDRGGLIEAEGGAAEGKLRAPTTLGREPVARSQRPVGQGGRRDFLLALELDLALDVDSRAMRSGGSAEARPVTASAKMNSVRRSSMVIP